MSVMTVVRIAKVLALLAFVLPWVAVSCNNVDIATATGIELIQGKMSENPDAGKQFNQQMGNTFGGGFTASAPGGGFAGADDAFSASGTAPELGLNFFGIAAAAVIVIGLLLSFVSKGRSAARNVMITSLLGIGLVFGTVWWWKEQVKTQQSAQDGGSARAESPFGGAGMGGPGMGGMGGGMLDSILQERFGYWLALGALVVAAGAGAVGMSGGAAGAKPEDAV